MLTAINEISIPIPYTEKKADLCLNGKNLIITGGNGSGKTSFITSIYEYLRDGLDQPTNNDRQHLEQQLNSHQYNMIQGGRDSGSYSWYEQEIQKIQKRLHALDKFHITTFTKDSASTRSLLRFHKALREAVITAPQFVPRLSALVHENAHFSNEKDGDNIFENYLISLKTSQSYAISFDKDEEKATRIQSWFDKIESDLQGLFEDSNLRLRFDSTDGKFFLYQNMKDKFTFQTLSSGYSSILRIYADLIMRIEMWDLTPESIEGIIFIDEIDAHLHVSLQKKILRFFSNSFPKVQFIVTTHSPFVVSSVTDAVIYDLSSNQQIVDVSSYSNNIILQELFGVNPMSIVLSDKLEEIEKIISSLNNNNVEIAIKIIQSLASSEESMDSEASAFVDFAKLQIIKYKKENAQEK
ncbi:AAA family ATPase [Enterobacter hormaechei]|jgi:predicted ATP-binding protein involved in virulence|uniref:AAA family ATPase n=1 Tax=Enterobacter hormaechei TaxID=158836 RepID=UPI000885FDFC|nr:AAA family ATPase [Enterobacter hormaechei]MBT1752883.1 AAA family ATPase [Enterobacter hormaechei subsp. xiangfangensis]SCZ29314.1 Predicted ATP-binding protein involved in virulence [Enterobacter hormaechei]